MDLAADQQTPGGDASSMTDDALIDQRVNELIERGLERYGGGELDAAIAEWEHALALAPENTRASEYVDYVRENYDLLMQRVEVMQGVEGADRLEVPFGLEPAAVGVGGEPDDDDDAYDDIVVSDSADAPEAPAHSAPARPNTEPSAVELDAGWALDDDAPADEGPAVELPPPPESATPGSAPVPEPPADLFDDDGFPSTDTVGADGELIGGSGELGFDFGDVPAAEPTPERGGGELGDDAEKTTEVGGRHMGYVRPSAPVPEADDELTVPGGVETETYAGDGLSLSDDALRAMSKQGLPRLERSSSPEETTAERSNMAGRLNLEGHESSETPSAGSLSELVLPGDDSSEEELTIERARWGGRAPAPSDFGDSDADLEKTRDRAAVSLFEASDRAPTTDPSLSAASVLLERPPNEDEDSSDDYEATREHRVLRSPAVAEFDSEAETKNQRRGPIEEFARQLQLPEELPGGPFGDLAVQLLIDVDSDSSPDESATDRVRRRMTLLLERAEREWQAGNHLVAVAAVDLALEEDPETAVAQKLIHRNKDRLFEIYRTYLGDLRRSPVLALPMHELAQQNIDNRAAFLLSRIDGTLSFEDVLDVSGMTRLETYRVIARMLIQGILEVR